MQPSGNAQNKFLISIRPNYFRRDFGNPEKTPAFRRRIPEG